MKKSILALANDPRPIIKKLSRQSVGLVIVEVPRIPADHPQRKAAYRGILKVIAACKTRLHPATGIVAIKSHTEQTKLIDWISQNLFEHTCTLAHDFEDTVSFTLFSQADIILPEREAFPGGGTKAEIKAYLKAREGVFEHKLVHMIYPNMNLNILEDNRTTIQRIIQLFGTGIVLDPFTRSTAALLVPVSRHERLKGQRVVCVTKDKGIVKSILNSYTLKEHYQIVKG